jgi:hypothetical protein
MPSHVLYVDDSGTKEYADDPSRYGRRGKSRYFVFGGLLISTGAASQLVGSIARLKYETFGDESIEIKSNWLRIPQERAKRYIEPYLLDDDAITRFVDAYYEEVLTAELMFIAAVVDKQHMQEVYPKPWYPPAVAYDALLQRVESELSGKGTVSVTIDDMMGATPHGNQYKLNLDRQHKRLKAFGSQLSQSIKYTCLEGRLKFGNSAHHHLIQVADIAAYSVYRQFVDYGERWEEEGLEELPMYDHLERIGHKFRQGPGGRVQGYGIAKLPMRRRVMWVVK